MRRFARIAPSLIALVVLLSVLHLLNISHYVINEPGQSLTGAAFSALGLCLNWYEGHTAKYLPGGWDVLWSLSIEEVFYLAFPPVCLLPKRQHLLVPCLVLLAASLPWTRAAALAGGEIWQQKAYLPGMSAIATGVLTAIVAVRMRPLSGVGIMTMLIAGWVGIVVTLFADDALWRLVHGAGLMLLLASTALLLLAFHGRASTDERVIARCGVDLQLRTPQLRGVSRAHVRGVRRA